LRCTAVLGYFVRSLLGCRVHFSQGGFFMRGSIPDSSHSGRSAFQQVAAAFLAQPGLPFADVLSADRIEQTFVRHRNLFGKNAVYSTPVMVWSFLGQALRDGKEASCQAAVARLAVHQQQCGAEPRGHQPRPSAVGVPTNLAHPEYKQRKRHGLKRLLNQRPPPADDDRPHASAIQSD
jgi:hypothetical protein